MSHSRKKTSNDKISTGLGDRLHPSYIVLQLKLKRDPKLSSGRKPINGSCRENSIILPRVEKIVFFW